MFWYQFLEDLDPLFTGKRLARNPWVQQIYPIWDLNFLADLRTLFRFHQHLNGTVVRNPATRYTVVEVTQPSASAFLKANNGTLQKEERLAPNLELLFKRSKGRKDSWTKQIQICLIWDLKMSWLPQNVERCSRCPLPAWCFKLEYNCGELVAVLHRRSSTALERRRSFYLLLCRPNFWNPCSCDFLVTKKLSFNQRKIAFSLSLCATARERDRLESQSKLDSVPLAKRVNTSRFIGHLHEHSLPLNSACSIYKRRTGNLQRRNPLWICRDIQPLHGVNHVFENKKVCSSTLTEGKLHNCCNSTSHSGSNSQNLEQNVLDSNWLIWLRNGLVLISMFCWFGIVVIILQIVSQLNLTYDKTWTAYSLSLLSKFNQLSAEPHKQEASGR